MLTPAFADDGYGFYAGTFLVEPSVGLFFESDNNALGSADDPSDDTATLFRPALKISNQWDNVDISLYGELESRRYEKFISQDTDVYSAQLRSRLEFAGAQSLEISLGASEYAERQNSAESFLGTQPLIEQNQTAAVNYERNLGRLNIAMGADHEIIRYEDSIFVIDETDPRDRDESYASVRAGMGESARLLYIGGRWGTIRHDLQTTDATQNPDADVTEAFIGFNYGEAGPYQLSGEVGAYQRQYDDTSVENQSGLNHRLRVAWEMTYLTQASLTSSRYFEETRILSSPGYEEINNQLSLNHQFSSSLALGLYYGWGTSDFESVEIQDEFTNYGITTSLLLGRSIEVSAGFNSESRSRRTGTLLTGETQRYERDVISAGVTLRY